MLTVPEQGSADQEDPVPNQKQKNKKNKKHFNRDISFHLKMFVVLLFTFYDLTAPSIK